MGVNIGIGACVGNRRYGRSVQDEDKKMSDIGDDLGDKISENNEEMEEFSPTEVRRQRHLETINKLLQ